MIVISSHDMTEQFHMLASEDFSEGFDLSERALPKSMENFIVCTLIIGIVAVTESGNKPKMETVGLQCQLLPPNKFVWSLES